MNKTKFAPLNDNIKNNPDIDYIVGDYSTFDLELSKIAKSKPCTVEEKKVLYDRAIKNLSKQKLHIFNNVLVNSYLNILLKRDFKERLKKFNSMSKSEKLSFAQDVFDEMFIIINKNGKLPRLLIEDSKKVTAMGFFVSNTDIGKNRLWINFAEP